MVCIKESEGLLELTSCLLCHIAVCRKGSVKRFVCYCTM